VLGPRPFASGSVQKQRSESRRRIRSHRTAASPRSEDEMQGPEHLARTFHAVHMRRRRLRAVRVRAFSKVRAHEGRGSRGPLPLVVGTLVLVAFERLSRGERRREPRVLCLWWHNSPEGEQPDLGLLWRAYVRRFDLEHTFRFLKQTLGWTAPRVRHPEQADRWTWLVLQLSSSSVRSRVDHLTLYIHEMAFSICSRGSHRAPKNRIVSLRPLVRSTSGCHPKLRPASEGSTQLRSCSPGFAGPRPAGRSLPEISSSSS